MPFLKRETAHPREDALDPAKDHGVSQINRFFQGHAKALLPSGCADAEIARTIPSLAHGMKRPWTH